MALEINEPVIHVMPERFYTAPQKGISFRTLFIVFATVLFIAVIGVASWYFTKDLRKVVPVATSIPEQSLVPALQIPETPKISVAPPAQAPPTIPSAPFETPAVAPEPTPPEHTGKPQRGIDSDADGLTDVEETLYGTLPTNPDTDTDGFLDGHELFHLYNPIGREPQKIIDSGVVKQYVNDKFGYHIFDPIKWTAEPTDATLAEVHFNSTTGEFVSILATENKKNLSLADWYKTMNSVGTVDDLGRFTTKALDEGLVSADGLTVYFKNKGYIIVVAYNIGDKNSIEYQRTFEMMLNSLVFLK